MKFKLEIDCSNAAFGDDEVTAYDEIRRIILDTVQRFDDGRSSLESNHPYTLRDVNGNKVGEARFIRS